jgi:hypothetical protein
MLTRLLAGFALMALCVVVHAAGLAGALRRLRRMRSVEAGFWPGTRLFIFVALWVVLLHLVEISAWAIVYAWSGAIGGIQSALYFSAVTYTTTGYGDIVLPPPWRMDGGIEALTGILMCGWSTGFFFALVGRISTAGVQTPPD